MAEKMSSGKGAKAAKRAKKPVLESIDVNAAKNIMYPPSCNMAVKLSDMLLLIICDDGVSNLFSQANIGIYVLLFMYIPETIMPVIMFDINDEKSIMYPEISLLSMFKATAESINDGEAFNEQLNIILASMGVMSLLWYKSKADFAPIG